MDHTLPLQVFVDDDDPGIVYQGRWMQAVSLSTELKSLNLSQSPHSPWYGTLHTPHGDTNFSFVFNGECLLFFRLCSPKPSVIN